MKITTEFNSTEELLFFIHTFGHAAAKVETLKGAGSYIKSAGPKVTPEMVNKLQALISDEKTGVKEDFINFIGKEKVEAAAKAQADAERPKEPVEAPGVVAAAERAKEKVSPAEDPKVELAEKKDPKDKKITKVMLRERVGLIMDSGKDKAVRDLVLSYGGSSLSEVAPKDYEKLYIKCGSLL